VQVGDRVGTQWIVAERIKQGERVVVEGVQKVRPGMQVNPKPFAAETRKGNPMSKVFYQPSHRRHGDFHRHGDRRHDTILSLPVAQFPNIAPPRFKYSDLRSARMHKRLSSSGHSHRTADEWRGTMNYMYSLNANGQLEHDSDRELRHKNRSNTDLDSHAGTRATQAA